MHARVWCFCRQSHSGDKTHNRWFGLGSWDFKVGMGIPRGKWVINGHDVTDIFLKDCTCAVSSASSQLPLDTNGHVRKSLLLEGRMDLHLPDVFRDPRSVGRPALAVSPTRLVRLGAWTTLRNGMMWVSRSAPCAGQGTARCSQGWRSCAPGLLGA